LFDEGRVLIPLLCVTAALASLGAIFFQLSTAPAGHRFVNLAFAAVTILLSWSFIQFIFAFHYALPGPWPQHAPGRSRDTSGRD